MQSRWGPHRVGPARFAAAFGRRCKISFEGRSDARGRGQIHLFSRAAYGAGAWRLLPSPLFRSGRSRCTYSGTTFRLASPILNIGILALFAITALSVYGVALAGWSSNSKYPLLGGLRSSAQMVSYELALTHVRRRRAPARGQLQSCGHHQRPGSPSGTGHLWLEHLAANPGISSASSSRPWRRPTACPFDLPEAESELVAGFHTEYASFKFAMFFIAEYTSMITVSCLCTIMFFGGWLSPFPASWTFTYYLPSVILIPPGCG